MNRVDALLKDSLEDNYRQTSRVFAGLMIGQWVLGVFLALVVSPVGWAGKVQSVSVHVTAAIWLGGALSSLPLLLAWKWPAAASTRHVIAVAQMLWSALLIHLTGGRIETHFHVFGSLAFLAFYRDWKVLVPATVVVAGDHLLRGILWPESVYGITNPEWWRFLEHAGWVIFEDAILVMACVRGVRELRDLAARRAEAEALGARHAEKSVALEKTLAELEASHEALTRSEKLAGVGQLAASVGHELRNPLATVRNGLTYVTKRVLDPSPRGEAARADPRVTQFLGLMDKELTECTRIISSLLDFARERPPELRPCPLEPVIQDALEIIPVRANVKVVSEVSAALPVPRIDRDQFRQVIANLVQNGVEAIPADRAGQVKVTAEGGGVSPWRISVSDNGNGIAPDAQRRLFQPLFTTKVRGTGLGLAIVAGLVKGHSGKIDVQSDPGKGTTFTITLPAHQQPTEPSAVSKSP
jgi:two-component system, NtrC family, sensor histidine kinase HydH